MENSKITLKNVLFICTGNSCRSVMAEKMFQKMCDDKGIEMTSVSAGIAAHHGMGASPETIALLKEFGVIASAHRAQPVTKELVDEASMVLAMTKMHESHLLDHFPEIHNKLFLLSKFYSGTEKHLIDHGIPDPIGMGNDFYNNVFEAIKLSLNGLMDEIVKES